MTKELLAKNIAGEVTLSDDFPTVLQKWREIFGIPQCELARELGISPSVISDYESGRRKSPGIGFIKNVVGAMIEIDERNGGNIIKKFTIKPTHSAILDLRELLNPISVKELVRAVKGKIVANKELANRRLKGYTVLDSIQAILKFSENDFIQIYGSTTERALIFTKVHLGRSPMIALKVTQPKPSAVVLHGLKPRDVDKLAVKIAKIEGIPLAVSMLKSEDDLIKNLRKIAS